MRNTNGKLSTIEFSIILYLTLPVFFFANFFKVYLSIPLLLFLFWQIYILISKTNFHNSPPLPNVLIAFILAALFTTLIGFVPFFNLQPTSDWIKHFSVFNDLRDCVWPPHFGEKYLRYYVGYYIVPSAIAKLFFYPAAVFFLYIWTIIGLTLVFLAINTYNSLRFILFIIAFMLFSGFDLLGGVLTHWSGIKTHAGYDWWSNQIGFQYLSMTNLLFWVPQHALPAWLVVSLFFKKNTSPILLENAALIFAATSLWSIFVAAGVFPYILLRAVQNKKMFFIKNFLTIIFLAVPIYFYLLSNAQKVPADFFWNLSRFNWCNYFIVIIVEVGIWIMWILFNPKSIYYDKSLMLLLIISLLSIPFIHIGSASDFAMRASIPSLTILALLVCHLLFMQPISKYTLIITIGLFLISAISPIMEINESINPKFTSKYEGWNIILRKETYRLKTIDFIGTHADPQLFATMEFLRKSPQCNK